LSPLRRYVVSQPFKVFYYEDEPVVAGDTKRLLEQLPAKPGAPLMKVSHYAQAWDAFKAIEQWAGNPPDVALLDIHEKDYQRAGIDICKRIKEDWPKVPVIFLSDFASIRDQTLGYEEGASVYLSKDLWDEPDCGQLLRTVLLRHIEIRNEPNLPLSVYHNGGLEVDMNIPRVCWGGNNVHLSPTDVDIVDELANDRDRGGLRTYARLAAIGGLRAESKTQLEINVKKHISNIRKAFRKVDEDFGKAGSGIVSVTGRGYRWQAGELHSSCVEAGQ